MCYTAILKFAVTNTIWDVAKYRKPEKFTLVDNPLDVAHVGGLVHDDDHSRHFKKMKKYIENNVYYDPNSPYTALKWYVHVNDPDYKPHFPKKPWDTTGYTDAPPRQTTVGHDLDGSVTQLKRQSQRSDGIQRRIIKLRSETIASSKQRQSDTDQPRLTPVPYYQRRSISFQETKKNPTVRQVLVSNVCMPIILYTVLKTLQQHTFFATEIQFSPF